MLSMHLVDRVQFSSSKIFPKNIYIYNNAIIFIIEMKPSSIALFTIVALITISNSSSIKSSRYRHCILQKTKNFYR